MRGQTNLHELQTSHAALCSNFLLWDHLNSNLKCTARSLPTLELTQKQKKERTVTYLRNQELRRSKLRSQPWLLLGASGNERLHSSNLLLRLYG